MCHTSVIPGKPECWHYTYLRNSNTLMMTANCRAYQDTQAQSYNPGSSGWNLILCIVSTPVIQGSAVSDYQE